MAETLPYGLRDVKLYPYTGIGTLGSAIDLPNSQTFSFEEAEDFEELRGDDKVVTTHGKGSSVNWELESGGISLEAYAAMAGGAITTSGTTPNVIKTYKKKTTDSRPEFKVEGQALSDSGGDFHVVLARCKASEKLSGELADGAFWLTAGSGIAMPSRVSGQEDEIYRFIQNETAVAIT